MIRHRIKRKLAGVAFALYWASASSAATGLWWDTDYALRRNVTVTTGALTPDKGYLAYTLRLPALNTAALIAAGDMQPDCRDLRVTYFDGAAWQDLPRHVIDCNSAVTDIRFASPAALPASSGNTDFYVYYGNPSAGAAAAVTPTNVYLWFDDATTDNAAAYDRGRGDPWHGTNWDNSLGYNAAGFYTYDTGDNFTSTYRRAVDERDVYAEAEFFHLGCYQLNMTTGMIVRGISNGSGGGETSTHYYASNRGQQNGGGCNTGGYSQDGDIFEDQRATLGVNGPNPPAIVRNQWRRQGLAAWSVNATNLTFWDEDNSANWAALGYPDNSNVHTSGVDNSSQNIARGYAGVVTAQDSARLRNILIRRYIEPEPVLTLGPQETPPGPMFSVTKSSVTRFDPVNLGVNPKAIPGADVDYILLIENRSEFGQSDADSIVIVDPIDEGVRLYVGDLAGAGPIEFIDGSGSASSGLTYNFISLSSSADDVEFSTDGSDFSYTPVPDIDGYDGNVTHLRITPKGTINTAPPGGSVNLSIRFRVRVR